MTSTVTPVQTTARTIPGENPPAAAGYNYALGYLRAALTTLVVAHHAVLAYTSFAPPPPRSLVDPSRWWLAFPIVDRNKWEGFGLLVGFNDVFFMSLMFFLSGLFVWSGLQRRGSTRFLGHRGLRLGIPLIASLLFLTPLAYYPTYLTTGGAGVSGFLQQWLSLGSLPTGPAWFLGLLLVFDAIAAGLYFLQPKWAPEVGNRLNCLMQRPRAFFAVLVSVSAAVYIPMAVAFNPMTWTTFGPLTFQTSRVLHNLAYFLLAVSLGAVGTKWKLLTAEGKLANHWLRWSIAAVLIFLVSGAVAIAASTMKSPPPALLVGTSLTFVLSCATSSIAFLALFLRFSRTRPSVLDSLTANAYGIYLFHYAFVTWLQYGLLGSAMPGLAKGVLVFTATLLLSWGLTAAVRRIPAVGRII